MYDGKNLGDSKAVLSAMPYTRVWTCLHAVFTWTCTIVFFSVLVNAYTVDIKENIWMPPGTLPVNNTTAIPQFTYKRSLTFPQNLGVLKKSSWSGVDDLFGLYEKPAASILSSSTPGANLTFTNAESIAIRDRAMRLLRCHGNVSTSSGSADTPLVGGITGATLTDVVVSGFGFDFSAPICKCVFDLHTEFYARAYTSGNVTNALVSRLGKQFLSGAGGATDATLFNISDGTNLLQDCIFASRNAQIVVADSKHWLAVSPYMVVMYINGIASIASCFYVICSRKTYDPWMYGLILVVSVTFVVFGFTGIWYSSLHWGTLGLATVGHVAVLLPVVMLVVFLMRSGVLDPIGQMNRMENIVIQHRLVFWIQYFLTLPAIVLLCDAMQQQKAEVSCCCPQIHA